MSPAPLADALATVAEAFASATVRASETGCGHCYAPAELDLLRTADASLPADLVALVAVEEPDHWDDHPALIRRIAPQLTELLGTGAAEPERIALGLARAGWQGWPDAQREALSGFLRSWCFWTFRQEAPPSPGHEVVQSCAVAASSVAPWLPLLAPGPVRSAAVGHWRGELACGAELFTWWAGSAAEAAAATAELRRWLGDPVPGVPPPEVGGGAYLT